MVVINKKVQKKKMKTKSKYLLCTLCERRGCFTDIRDTIETQERATGPGKVQMGKRREEWSRSYECNVSVTNAPKELFSSAMYPYTSENDGHLFLLFVLFSYIYVRHSHSCDIFFVLMWTQKQKVRKVPLGNCAHNNTEYLEEEIDP